MAALASYATSPPPNILNLIDGKCFLARHPLLGATGDQQSPWIKTARLIIESGKFDKVVIITTAIGGTGLHEWAPGGEFHQRMLDRIAEAKAVNLTPTHFLWHQGEQEGAMKKPGSEYLRMFKAMVASVRQHANVRVVLAMATRCQADGPYEPIREAQRIAAVELADAKVIDSDVIGLAYRYDGCHFTKAGLDRLAKSYADAILSF